MTAGTLLAMAVGEPGTPLAVTQFPGVEQGRCTVDAQPLQVPTDHGLTDQPVERDDYPSAAPP